MSPLPFPIGRQSHVIHLASNQHNVVLGTAGTGKSTMAMLRAIHLSRPTTVNNGPVLVVTYNNALTRYLRYLGAGSASGVTVETYGRFARGYLASVGRMEFNAIAGPECVDAYVQSAVARVAETGHPGSALASRAVSWFTDELHWISGMGITSEAGYQAAQRIGRQTPLPSGSARDFVWAVRDVYLHLRSEDGFSFDWYDIANAVNASLATDSRVRLYRHIIIDEGQDLSPEAIRSLTAAVQHGGSVTFFGDYHQAIYGQGLSWRSSGIQLHNRPIEKFVDNYRNTAQVAGVAIAMAQADFMRSADGDLVSPRQPTADGPKPVLARYESLSAESAAIRELAVEASKDQTVAILCRTWADAVTVAGTAPYRRLDSGIARWDERPGLYVGTYHSAKGLEFDAVFMPRMTDDRMPFPEVLAAFTEDEACSREARLLYVSITRARSSLIITYTGRLSRLLPTNEGLWDARDMS